MLIHLALKWAVIVIQLQLDQDERRCAPDGRPMSMTTISVTLLIYVHLSQSCNGQLISQQRG